MDKNRRKFISTLIAAGILSPALFGFSKLDSLINSEGNQNNLDIQDLIFNTNNHNDKRIFPKGLVKNSKIAIIAPASHASVWELRKNIRLFKSMNLKVEVSDIIKNYQKKYRYFAAPDEVRAKEFMNYIQREDVDALMTCRGGYGVMRILDLLDFNIIKANPKIIIGFSDITALLNAVYKLSNIITYHGPVGVSTFNSITLNSFKKTLFYNKNYKPIVYKDPRIKTIVQGIAKGKLVGGNLSMLVSTLGTKYEIETEHSILFLEETSEDPYKIDRMLTQLAISNKLQTCSGIMFGYYKGLDSKKNFYPYRSFTAREVIENRLKKIGVPAVLGIPIGHIPDKWTLPIGVEAELNADKRTITILENPVGINN